MAFDLAPVVQTLINGTLLGGLYALMGEGFSVIFGIQKIMNIGHGCFVVLGAYVAYFAWRLLGLDPVLSVALSVPILLGVGAVTFLTCCKPMMEKEFWAIGLLLYGFALVAENLMVMAWTGDYRNIRVAYTATAVDIGGFYFSTSRVIGFAAAIIMIALFAVFFKYTYMGKACRALAQNREAAALLGVNGGRIDLLVFMLGTATAGVAGTFIALVYTFYPSVSWNWMGVVMGVVFLGGMGSISGTLVGGIIVGIAESMVGNYVTPFLWKETVPYIILIVVLLVRPTGIFGRFVLGR